MRYEILFISKEHYYIPRGCVGQIINNIREDENNMKSVRITINDLSSKLYNEKLKIAKRLPYQL